MWIQSVTGFYSIVDKGGEPGELCLRARATVDLDALRARYLPELGPTEEWTGSDYRYRAWAPREAVGRALGDLAMAIDYDNFKDAVEERDPARARIYHDVWSALWAISRS